MARNRTTSFNIKGLYEHKDDRDLCQVTITFDHSETTELVDRYRDRENKDLSLQQWLKSKIFS